MKYNQSMASILAEMNKVKKEQEGETQDPIDQAKKKIDKIKKVAILKKQMADIQKSEDTDLEEKVEYIEYKFRNSKQAVEAVRFVQAMNINVPRNLDINDDQENKGIIVFDAGKEEFTKVHKMIMKKFKPQILAVEKLDKDIQKSEDTDLEERRYTKKEKDSSELINLYQIKNKTPKIKARISQLEKQLKIIKSENDLEEDISDETDLEEFKTMTVTLNDPKRMKDLIQAIRIFGPKRGLKTDVMNPKKLKVYGNNTDLNKYATDLKNYYGAEIKAESYEPLEEFTDKQIERLRKEYEDLRGKETGINPEKFKKLRGMMKRFPKANLLKLVKADIPILTTGAKAALVMYHGMQWKQLPEDFLPYIEIFADDNQELSEVKQGKFKEVDPKVIDRVEKMMRGSRAEKDSIANMMNYLMPPEVVDMIRYKLKITQKRGRIKF